MRKASVAAVLGSLLLLVSPAPAYAHADLVRSSPAAGSVLVKAPTAFRLDFSEDIAVDKVEFLGSTGGTIPCVAETRGSQVLITPSAPLPAGPITITYAITSDDGHQVDGAVAYLLGRATTSAPAQRITTAPSISTTLSGSHPGALRLSFAMKALSGEVTWTSSAIDGALTWPIRSAGKSAAASGVLPLAGVWKLRATLIGAKGAIIITTGTATLSP